MQRSMQIFKNYSLNQAILKEIENIIGLLEKEIQDQTKARTSKTIGNLATACALMVGGFFLTTSNQKSSKNFIGGSSFVLGAATGYKTIRDVLEVKEKSDEKFFLKKHSDLKRLIRDLFQKLGVQNVKLYGPICTDIQTILEHLYAHQLRIKDAIAIFENISEKGGLSVNVKALHNLWKSKEEKNESVFPNPGLPYRKSA